MGMATSPPTAKLGTHWSRCVKSRRIFQSGPWGPRSESWNAGRGRSDCSSPLAIRVGFLTQDDFIDQTPARRIIRGSPGNRNTAQPLLQGLQQGHEIPDGEDVILHKRTQCRRAFQSPRQWVGQQRFTQRLNFVTQLVRTSRRGESLSEVEMIEPCDYRSPRPICSFAYRRGYHRSPSTFYDKWPRKPDSTASVRQSRRPRRSVF